MLDAFLSNVILMRKVLRSKAFQECIKASKESSQKKLDAHLKTWVADAPYFCARKALLISGPVASLCRKVAGEDFFIVYPVWLEARLEVAKAVEDQDFADVTKKEDAAAVSARREKVAVILDKRGELWISICLQKAHRCMLKRGSQPSMRP